MSRSVHATRADFRRAQWFDFADAAQRQEHQRVLALGIRKERRIKQLIRTARKTPERVDLAPVPPDAIPIEVVDSGPLRGGAHTETCTPNAGPSTRAVFRCIRFLGARKLGRPDAGVLPSAETLDDLRRYSYGAWADRLAAEMAR